MEFQNPAHLTSSKKKFSCKEFCNFNLSSLMAMSKVVSSGASKLKAIICPSMLSCDFAQMGKEGQRMVDSGADWLHMDVMDGHFVPNITIGAPIIKSLRKALPNVFLDCHLMVSDPMKWVKDFQSAGASQITFHFECIEECKNNYSHKDIIHRINECGMKAAMAIKPKTPLQEKNENSKGLNALKVIEENIEHLNMILIMTVEPGFGGQNFMEDMMPKVKLLRQKFPHLNIQVDGGVNVETIDTCSKAGANVIVSGSGFCVNLLNHNIVSRFDILKGGTYFLNNIAIKIKIKFVFFLFFTQFFNGRQVLQAHRINMKRQINSVLDYQYKKRNI
ncbi:hypothetical protein RFI_15993 [Reticulomyxa filosa]|uniref:Ribulose-phosphate 3-epimerase n=1 Tax=Reticulomyxa filosa TaxID=46433 RepID=X6N7C1_RETFI|nr:hypothetical protein RFI_15993 [Reticulomyxa filosa]|eukprot:ETO21212.1 hypothetical protein RFI_15993 [Reticulomyxa filosa]